MWNADEKMMLSVKVEKESMLGKIHELEKQCEQLKRTLYELKCEIQIVEEPAQMTDSEN